MQILAMSLSYLYMSLLTYSLVKTNGYTCKMFRIPSLQALKIFDMVCRKGSFTSAANELNVSQGAISQHIKALEIRVGFPVFIRSGRSISLTPSGMALIDSVRKGIEVIEETISYERHKHKSQDLMISVQPGFAIRWLFPRLMDFHEEHPTTPVSVNAITEPTDFSLYQAHAGMAYGPELQGNNDTAIFKESIFPVCSPAFADAHELKPLSKRCLMKLPSLPLLGDQSPAPRQYGYTWRYWAAQSGVELPADAIRRSTQSNITLQLAELGHGVALGRTSLVMDSLRDGKLVQLTAATLQNPCVYQLLKNPAFPKIQSLGVFTQWLSQMAREIEAFDRRDVMK